MDIPKKIEAKEAEINKLTTQIEEAEKRNSSNDESNLIVWRAKKLELNKHLTALFNQLNSQGKQP